jgi:hypothetical protein
MEFLGSEEELSRAFGLLAASFSANPIQRGRPAFGAGPIASMIGLGTE